MPDPLGRYSLLEMRELTRRLIDGIRPIVDVTTGDEAAPVILDPLFSNKDLNFFINSAITMTFVDMVGNNEEVFADETLVDITANVLEYSLPEDLIQVRGMWWKRPSTSYTIVPKTHRLQMYKRDDASPIPHTIDNGAPSYRFMLNFFTLNEPSRVTQDNPQGVLIEYIKIVNYMDVDDAILETQFARVMQELVVRRAAIEAIEKRTKLDASGLYPDRDAWVERLMLMVRNFMNPATVRMITGLPRIRRQTRSILR